MRTLLFLLMIAISLPAHAARVKSAEEQLARAELQYEEFNYKGAAAALTKLLKDKPTNAKTRQRARLMQAFSYYYLRNDEAAKASLRELLRENVDYPFDREMHHPDLVRFFDTEHAFYVSSVTVRPKAQVVTADPPPPEPTSVPAEVVDPIPPPSDQPASMDDEPSTLPLVLDPAPVTTLGDRHPWLRIFPIVGHFANHDHVGGAVFLSLEVALIGMNVGGAVARALLRYPEGDFRVGAKEAQIVQDIGGFGAITVAVVCILDAFVWSPARGRAALEKTTVSLGALGDYRLVFAP